MSRFKRRKYLHNIFNLGYNILNNFFFAKQANNGIVSSHKNDRSQKWKYVNMRCFKIKYVSE